ncbi:fibre [Skunk adenovirus 1]|uniref:Fibre n=1 Tax=Skunk adenovirus 1 TaxID=2698728 RepID=A0A0K0MGD1_9ADEN|nr:fibre [Skunk adenovirus PB1]AKC34860.1 fibre [Skunk adenovirus PB1]QKF54482.1 fiber [Skunk adenovirus HUN/2009]
MKRARPLPADYDPVYPYWTTTPSTQPPYFNEKRGLTQAPPGTLAVKATYPLSFNNLGQLKLNIGAGLALNGGNLIVHTGEGIIVNDKGQLTAASDNNILTFAEPLKKTDDTVSLTLGAGLKTNNGALEVEFPPLPPIPPVLSFSYPLEVLNNTVSLKIGSGLAITNNTLNTVPNTVLAPLEKTDQGIKLKIGTGLTLVDNALAVQFPTPPAPPAPISFQTPLTQNNNSVSLNIGQGLAIQNNQLVATATGGGGGGVDYEFVSPLFKVNKRVALQMGQGLTLDNERLSVKVGSGISIQNGALTANLPQYQFIDPLSIVNGRVALQIGQGLTLLNNRLSVNTGSGISIQNGALTVNFPNPTTFTSPLKKEDNDVHMVLGNGLTTDNGELVVKLNKGLTFRDTRIEAKLGPGLYFNSDNAISATNTQVFTLWTGPEPSLNASISNNTPTIRCFICLSRVGDLVHVTANFKGEGNFTNLTNTTGNFSLKMDFNQWGQLMSTGNITDAATWGQKVGDTVVPGPSQHFVLCMPNKKIYKSGAPSFFVRDIQLNALAQTADQKTIQCVLQLNNTTTPTASYSVTFRFVKLNTLPAGNTLFVTDNIDFTYVGQN